MLLRDATPADLAAIDAIYEHYVTTSTCTFQTTAGSMEERRAWFEGRGPMHPVLVSEEGGEVVAWGALSRYHRREGYAPTVEDSIYVRHDRRGHGHGRALLRALIARGEAAGARSILGIIAADQPGSLALHEAEGFAQVGLIKEAGFKLGRWIDVAFLQRMLGAAR